MPFMPDAFRLTVPNRRDGGFVLVTVLLIAGLLATLAATLASAVQTKLRVTGNIIANAQAEALADAGVSLALHDMLAARNGYGSRLSQTGGAFGCSVPGVGALMVHVTDEAGKVDVNTAGLPLIQTLLAGAGAAPDAAAALAQAIVDFRDADDIPLPNGAERDAYTSAGMGWPPKNGPLQSVGEVEQVQGMEPALLSRLRPHLTVYTGLEGIDMAVASGALTGLLRDGVTASAGAFASFPEADPRTALPAMFASASPRRFFSVRAEARTATGAVYVREAVVDLGVRTSNAVMFLKWAQGALAEGSDGLAPVGTSGEC